jgi:radical SAM protein (TIGR01212 family)
MLYDDKRFYSLNYFFRQKFNTKIVKVSLDCGFTCPNRDGTLSYGGCIFCSDRGSGDFTNPSCNSLIDQFNQIKQNLDNKWPKAKYIAHLQAFTNTYAPIEVLRKTYYEAMTIPNLVGIAIATRPDCLAPDVLDLLYEISQKTYVFIELGLQSSSDLTGKLINRGYDLECFEQAVFNLRARNIDVVTHLILGLPNETKTDILSSVKYLSKLDIQGIKLQMLYILKNTPIAKLYEKTPFYIMNMDEYISIIVDCIELLPQNIVIHRLTGDGPKDTLIAPLWSKNKRLILNAIDAELKNRESFQGKFYS